MKKIVLGALVISSILILGACSDNDIQTSSKSSAYNNVDITSHTNVAHMHTIISNIDKYKNGLIISKDKDNNLIVKLNNNNGTKEKPDFETPDKDKMAEWALKEALAGNVVTILYDEKTKTYCGWSKPPIVLPPAPR